MAGRNDPVLVVGGGLGGAAVALALARKGLRVQVLEQAPEFGVIGYGIQLGPNVFPMFDRLGVTEAVMAKALVPEAILMVDYQDAGEIVRIPTGELRSQKRFGAPYIVIHRVDLHRRVARRLRKGAGHRTAAAHGRGLVRGPRRPRAAAHRGRPRPGRRRH